MEFVTLSREDSSLSAYLNGTFAKDQRALPVSSLHRGTPSEQITFQIVPVETVSKPSGLVLFWKALRPEWLSLTLSPFLLTSLYWGNKGYDVSPFFIVSALFCLFCLHMSVFLLNDYSDYLKGADQLSPTSGSQLIRLGWVTARQVKLWGLFFLFLGVLSGLMILTQEPLITVAFAFLGLLALLSYSLLGHGLKYQGWGDVVVFLALGPLLVGGVSVALGASLSGSIFFLSLLMGQMAALVIEGRQLESLTYDHQARVGTLMVRWGFDRGKRWILFQILMSWSLLMVFVIYEAQSPWALLGLLPPGLLAIQLRRQVRMSNSSLSSPLRGIYQRLGYYHLLTSLIVGLSLWL